MKSKHSINDKIATSVTKYTGNMWFFWVSLTFIIVLRITSPPTRSELLLNLENDLQLLLLAANAVVGAKQINALQKILKHIDKEADQIEKQEKETEKLLESK